MNPKISITEYVAKKLNIPHSGKELNNLIRAWWVNPRNKNRNGLGLTKEGFNCLCNADIKFYKVKFETSPQITNQFIIQMDNFINCPFFITKFEIYVFDDKTAIQLVLFSGNIQKFVKVKAKNSYPA